ncbi:P-loop NTPase [Papillibacter cinnamivorans]|uniref:NUBPL iron-transfer P-loop NTPase n=1 Tax=Papillibacter cinnamivorans DSM 12816 TaxID=1122930 RepID=A0A1W2CR48_9FIRM|nr:P-loop NTPase [Papillibacter cinnamivorans]SMC87689.1 NUBPL iron-transfer P-loop NTPase [Papillibacter cinnamivorans DSM 12816]
MEDKEKLQEQLNQEMAEVWENSSCSGSCSTCSGGCSDERAPRQAKRAYAVVSGKGGTGKSLITVLLALTLQRRGLTVGILDADVAGATIPRLLGDRGQIGSEGELMIPHSTADGLRVISMDLIADNPADPIIWSGADTSNIAALFWNGVDWGQPDCLLIDMPSGFGDIPIQLFTTLPLDGVIAVAAPGETAALSVGKMLSLCNMLLLPVVGFVENMAFPSGGDAAELYSLPEDIVKITLPYDPSLSRLGDKGALREAPPDLLAPLADRIAEEIRGAE